MDVLCMTAVSSKRDLNSLPCENSHTLRQIPIYLIKKIPQFTNIFEKSEPPAPTCIRIGQSWIYTGSKKFLAEYPSSWRRRLIISSVTGFFSRFLWQAAKSWCNEENRSSLLSSQGAVQQFSLKSYADDLTSWRGPCPFASNLRTQGKQIELDDHHYHL